MENSGIIYSAVKISIFLYIINSQSVKSDHVVMLTYPIFSVVHPLIPTIDELFYKYGHTTTVVMTNELAESTMVKNSTIDVVVSENLKHYNFSAFLASGMETGLRGNSPWSLETLTDLTYFCDLYLSDEGLFNQLKRRKFKLAVVYKSALAMCLNVLAYKLSVPFIHCGQGYDPVNDRIPYSPSFVPAYPIVPFSDRMDLSQRVINHVLFVIYTFLPDVVSPNNVINKYVPNKPYVSTIDLWRKTEFHLIEFDILLDYPRPVFQNYAYIGGIGTMPAKSLKTPYKEFMDSATNGAIIVSFGSLATEFPDHIISKFMTCFHKLSSLKFVFKHGKKLSINQNTLMSPWIPQNDLLGHRNTRLFITHCGNGGQFEALYHGVPMIGFPLFSEQHSNAKRMETKGYGITMKINDFTVDELIFNINEVLYNRNCASTIKTASNIFKSRPDTPKQRMAYWIDHVMKYGGKYMRPASVDIPFYQFVMLDVIFVLVVSILFVTICLKITCSYSKQIFKQIKTKPKID